MESRILLSADLVPRVDLAPSVQDFDDNAFVLLQDQPLRENITVGRSGWDSQTSEDGLTGDVTKTSDNGIPASDGREVADSLLTSYSLLPLDEAPFTNSGITGLDTPSSIADQLIETLSAANALPAAAEMDLINGDLSQLSGQTFYLDFDGASGLDYDGPVRIEDVEVRPFQFSSDLPKDDNDFIASIVAALNERFSSVDVSFTRTQPQLGAEYSSIFIGGDDSAFSRYGSFFGLAEQVDVGNQDRNDNGFVFSEKILQYGMDSEDYPSALTEVIEHEALHLLGYAHASGETSGLNAVADVPPPMADGATITVNGVKDSNDRDEVLTLREAILVSNRTLAVSGLTTEEKAQINGTPDANTRDIIRFNIPADSIKTIIVGTGGLPYIFDPVFIDGTTQPGFDTDTHMPVIEISPVNAGANEDGFTAAGLEILGGGTTVKGLVINRAPGDGIRIRTGGGNTIIGNFI